ncbi:MAG: hypothetical protein M9921_13125 [Fimbriimonadaceae bacterium]|nr:hypothetical protein [Fimbriimonadaceae bacterium]
MAKVAAAVAVAVCLASCGGRGDSAALPSSLTTLSFSVDWGERSRTFAGPGSAQSVVVRVAAAGLPAGDAVATANRDANPAAHTQTVFTGLVCKSGVFPVSAIFYADRDGGGAVVGLASGLLTVDSGGALQGTLATQGTIASVSVGAGQSLVVGETKQLLYSARGDTGTLIAVSPGSVLWHANNSNIAFLNGYAKGVVVGSSQVTATIDGHPSAPVAVNVTWF